MGYKTHEFYSGFRLLVTISRLLYGRLRSIKSGLLTKIPDATLYSCIAAWLDKNNPAKPMPMSQNDAGSGMANAIEKFPKADALG